MSTREHKLALHALHWSVFCLSRWQPQDGEQQVPLLMACNISSDAPGDYNITLSITNSAGLTTSLNRTITVLADCLPGEKWCADKVGKRFGTYLGCHPYMPCICSSLHSVSSAYN